MNPTRLLANLPSTRSVRTASGLGVLLALMGCGHSERAPGEPAPPAPAPAADATPAPPAGSPGGPLHWTKPSDWVEEPPSTPARLAQYRLGGAGGDAECQVFHFGPGQGGDAQANADRWKEQFTKPDGSPADDAFKTTMRNINGIRVLIVETTGTYSGGVAIPGQPPPQPVPDAMLMGAIAEAPDGNWFFKLVGPEKTVKGRRDSFMGLVRSIKAGD